MFEIVLYQPEIPPNTGNIIRLCAVTGCRLHLIEPLAFWLDDRQLRRAGLDYAQFAAVQVHRDWQQWQARKGNARQLAFTTAGPRRFDQFAFRPGDALVFGSESRGLPQEVLEYFEPGSQLRLPMLADRRSLNLSNAVSIAVYEAWRQNDFRGGS